MSKAWIDPAYKVCSSTGNWRWSLEVRDEGLISIQYEEWRGKEWQAVSDPFKICAGPDAMCLAEALRRMSEQMTEGQE